MERKAHHACGMGSGLGANSSGIAAVYEAISYHRISMVWQGLCCRPSPPSLGACPPPPPPPPPPPNFDLSSMGFDDCTDGRIPLSYCRYPKPKNPTLRTGPAPFKPTQFGFVSAAGPAAASMVKDPIFTRDGKKWLIEYQKNNPNLLVENVEMNNVVYVFKSEDSTLTVKRKYHIKISIAVEATGDTAVALRLGTASSLAENTGELEHSD
ncbi:hypothetical protein GQX74_011712 [Glossina fuscipes]|nr:hypothetical protein GQX74_011712 [Glossina fuscipes]